MIRIHDLRIAVEGRVLLDDFSLDIKAGDRVTMTGSSGCGKTTFLHCLMGFRRPQSGRILVKGVPLEASSMYLLRRHLAYVAQSPELDGDTVLEALQAPFQYKANRRLQFDRRSVDQVAGNLLLSPDILDQAVATLSGGERQRVALLGALLLDRPILLLDEITAALDAKSRDATLAVLRELKSVTIISVSHDPVGFPLGDRVVHLEPAARGEVQ